VERGARAIGFPDRLIRPGTDSPNWARLGRRAEFLVLDFLEQQSQGPVEDRARVTVRDLATEKALKAAKLLMGLLRRASKS
jgi:hypothetical protein